MTWIRQRQRLAGRVSDYEAFYKSGGSTVPTVPARPRQPRRQHTRAMDQLRSQCRSVTTGPMPR